MNKKIYWVEQREGAVLTTKLRRCLKKEIKKAIKWVKESTDRSVTIKSFDEKSKEFKKEFTVQ